VYFIFLQMLNSAMDLYVNLNYGCAENRKWFLVASPNVLALGLIQP